MIHLYDILIDMETIALGILAMFLGAILVVGGGGSFACNSGAILFCYGLFGVFYACLKKFIL